MPELARCRIPLIAILLVASVARLVQVGQSSLWYDEVVTMRLARTQGPSALFGLLQEIDATRAPLHPLLLQGWIALLGPSDLSGRALSALCGIVTVALVYWVGLRAFDRATGLWASWLCALSPLLVYYSREVRMYALLVLLTCLGWGCLFAQRRSPRPWWLGLYGLCLIALGYSHPLGLLMIAALGLASVLNHRAFGISWRGWLLTHAAVGLALVPWVGRYFDHEPESVTGLLPLRFLFGMPIGFIGGNFQVLLLFAMLIAFGQGVVHRREEGRLRVGLEHPVACVSLLIWLVLPPLVLYAYSRVSQPIFGSARYTLFSGPAYLILVARGLARLPAVLRYSSAAGSAALSGVLLLSMVFRPDLKADWRGAAAFLDRGGSSGIVAVISADPSRNVEFESARYYLGPHWIVIPCPNRLSDLTGGKIVVWVSIGLRDGQTAGALPEEFVNHKIIQKVVDFPGLRLMRVELDPT
jgi:mannosyltransferase